MTEKTLERLKQAVARVEAGEMMKDVLKDMVMGSVTYYSWFDKESVKPA